MKTTMPKKREIKTEWHFINAKDMILGRVASDIARLLIGKHKAEYTPHINVGDKVVVTNSKNLAVTGNKEKDKVYYRHTGYPGGVRSETLGELMERRPNEALKRAVKRMLPKNKLRKERMKNLYVYEGSEHPHEAQKKVTK